MLEYFFLIDETQSQFVNSTAGLNLELSFS